MKGRKISQTGPVQGRKPHQITHSSMRSQENTNQDGEQRLHPLSRQSSQKVLKMQKLRNTHYSKASIGQFPETLLFMRYQQDHFKTHLQLDPTHPIGQFNPILNLQYWSNIRTILEQFIEKNPQSHPRLPYPFEELNCTNSSEFDDELFEIILNSYLRKQIQKLVISNCRLISLQGLLGICSMENLIALDISGNELVTDQLIETMVSSLMQLQHLNVSRCPEITDTALQSIAYHRHKHLLSFSCENSDKISYVGMNDLIMKCEQLQKINVADCPKVTFIGVVVNVRDNQLQYIGRNVQYLNVNNCHQLQYYSLCWMMTALPMLVEFSAVGVHAIDDNILRSMISGCPMLMKINVNYCRRVTMDIFRYLGQLYKLQFEELHFAKMSSHDPYQSQNGSGTGDNGVRSHLHSPLYHHFHAFLKKAAEKLIQLDLSENKFINDDCFQITLPSKESPPPYLSRSLRFLNLSLCTAVTSLGIVSLIPNYPNLESLNLSGLKYINDSALQIIAYYCKQLKVLSINGCVSLTDLGILAICHHCKALIELNASYDVDMEGNITGEQYSDEILEGIFLAAKKLRKVCLHNQARLKFHNKWLKYFIKYFANYSLQSINLIGCTNIMMDSLQPLLKKCYLLNNLLLPHHLFTNSQIVSKKFWYETFANTIYTETFNQQDMDEQCLAVRQSLTIVVDVRKARIPPAKLRTAAGMDTNNITSEKKKSLFLHLLKPHPNAPILQYRDQYIQRRLLEKFAIRIIQKGWYVHKIWQKFKYNILSRKIARRLYIYHLQRQFEKKVRFFTENHAAKKLQKFIIKYLLQYNRAVRLVIYHYRKWSRRKKLQNYIIQMKKIVLIQARVRGMLVRLSERYILSQIYLKLPKFWKIVANYANDEYQKQMRDKKLPIPPGVMDPNLLKGGKRLGLQRQNTKRKMLEVQQEEKEEEKQLLSYLQAYASPEKIRSLHSIPLSKTAINGYEVEELKDGAQEMLQSIRQQMQERITNHQKPFAIPISIMIPQSFDSKPYVSLFDGRKLSYYGNTSSIFNEDFTNKTKNLQHFTEVSKESLDFFQGKGGSKHSSNSPPHSAAGNKRSLSHSNSHKAITTDDISTHLPIHVYQNKFYPLVHPKKRENITSDLVLYNPMVNNFELAKNYQKVLYCQMCSNRLRMILCKTCSRGYCFFCAFQYHNSLIHRNHQMEFMEPRIVHVEKVSQSLIYHIDNASNIMYDLRYVVKYLRSKAELAKITEEKRLLREYERKQEQMRIAILQAQQEYNEKQDSVMLITLLYRSYKAKKIVKEKRIQLQLEKFLLQNKKIFTSIIKIQVLFRRYQIRHWFYSKSFVFRGIPKYYKLIHATTGGNNKNTVSPVKQQTPPSKVLVRVRKTDNRGKLFPFDELRKLVTKCNHRRHIYERTMIIGDIEDKYSQILQLLNANIEFWINYNQSILPKIEKYSKLRDDYYEKLTIKSQQFLLANLSNTQKDKELNDKILREMKLKVDCLQERIDNLKNIVWWIKHHLRFCYRKLALLPLRLQDLLKQLIWIYTENMLLQRVRIHGEKRIAIMTEIVNNALLAREKKREAKEKEEEAAALAAAAKNGGTTTVAITTVVTSTDAAKKQTGAVSAETKNSPVKGPNNNKLSKEKEKELTENDFMTMPKEWLIEKINSIINQLVAIDVSQESILKEEITKLELDYYEIISFDSLLEELIQSLMANNQIIAEKVTLEVKLIHLGYGSEEAIRVNESLVVLKNKQKQLVHGSIDAIKVALQSKYDEQEKKYLMLYSFPGDAPELPIEEMKKISCILLDEFDTRRSHIDSTHFLKVYYLQPWITNDAIEDIRYEERLAAKQLKLGKLREELNGITYRVQENENKKKGMLQQIREVETQIEVAKDIVPDESDFQKEKREKNLIKLEEEKNAFELELRGIEASLNELAIIDVPLQNLLKN